MTNHKTSLLIVPFFLLFSSIACGQDFSLSHLSSDSPSFLSDSVTDPGGLDIGQLPTSVTQPVPVQAPAGGDVSEENFTKNLAVLAAFASLLALGGAIVAYVGFVRRKARRVTPMRMVQA